MRRDETGLDPRAWLAWGFAASLTPLLGRNPFPLTATLLAVLSVRAIWSGTGTRAGSWGGIVRLATVFALIGVAFNVLTVRSGDRVLATLPESVPLLDGPITVNALVYGLLSALAVITLILAGTTVGAAIDWPAAIRLLPRRLTTFAVAGSVAFAFIPSTAVAFREIREAQAIRGHRFRGVRDLVPIVVPLLTGGLERAVTMAEALESRGFGGSQPERRVSRPLGTLGIAIGLAALPVAGYLLAVGRLGEAGIAGAVALISLVGGLRAMPALTVRRTRYRSPRWKWADTATVVGASIVVFATLLSLSFDGASLQYEPYPTLDAPHVNLPLIFAQLALLMPAFVAPLEDAP